MTEIGFGTTAEVDFKLVPRSGLIFDLFTEGADGEYALQDFHLRDDLLQLDIRVVKALFRLPAPQYLFPEFAVQPAYPRGDASQQGDEEERTRR